VSPVVGSGVGYQLAPDFGDSSNKIITDGFWWAILMEAGITSIILSFLFLWGIVRVLYRYEKKLDKKLGMESVISNYGLAIIVIGVAGNFVNSSLNNQVMHILFYMILGIIISKINIGAKKKKAKKAKKAATYIISD
jgi:hypothetical protein